MKPLTVYECEYCKKLFRTPNRHHCKFNPALKNCFTCKHCKGWKESTDSIDVGIGFLYGPNYPDCGAGWDGWDITAIQQVGYNMQCEGWEAKGV